MAASHEMPHSIKLVTYYISTFSVTEALTLFVLQLSRNFVHILSFIDCEPYDYETEILILMSMTDVAHSSLITLLAHETR
jgi:hypothetical protein